MIDPMAASLTRLYQSQLALLQEIVTELQKQNVTGSALLKFNDIVWRQKFVQDVANLITGRNRLLTADELAACNRLKATT